MTFQSQTGIKNLLRLVVILILNHTILMERAFIYNLTDKFLFLLYKKFHKKNFEIIINALLNNNYPLDFINKPIKKRTKKVFL